jgi:hypothetical protein
VVAAAGPEVLGQHKALKKNVLLHAGAGEDTLGKLCAVLLGDFSRDPGQQASSKGGASGHMQTGKAEGVGGACNGLVVREIATIYPLRSRLWSGQVVVNLD